MSTSIVETSNRTARRVIRKPAGTIRRSTIHRRSSPSPASTTALDCAKCHTAVSVSATLAANRVADFRGLKTTCVGCHADVHGAELGTACESCHTSTTFQLASYTHPRFPEFFGGQHAPLTCDKCHVPAAPTRPVRTGVTHSRRAVQERHDGLRELPPGRAPGAGERQLRDLPHGQRREVCDSGLYVTARRRRSR